MPQLTAIDLVLYATSLGLAFAVSVLMTPIVGIWATQIGMVAAPRQDRWHQKPTPLLGGVAIFIAATTVIVAFVRLDARLLGLVVGGSILFSAGLLDDLRHLRPHTKLIIQILAACVLIVSGVRVETTTLQVVSIPLTILWVVGLTNAFNLLDNMDGLSAGTAAIAALFLGAFSIAAGNAGTAILCLAILGASLGFLVHNFNPARIFMGDSGSMFLGYLLSAVALLGTREMASDIFFVLLVPVAMMGLPIFDTALVTIIRTLEGRPVSQGGRDHLSHRLVALGLSERQAVLLLYVVATSFGSLGLLARAVGVWLSLAVAGVLFTMVVLFGAYLAEVRIYAPAKFAEAAAAARLANRPVVNGMIMFKRELGMATLDFILVAVAYMGAYLLRFGLQGYGAVGTELTAPWPRQFSESLPFVLVAKLGALLLFQAYRGMMRYVGVSDLLAIAKATLSSSLLLAVVLPLALRHEVFPKSVLVIDWLLFTVLAVGSRVSFAALTDTFARLQRQRLPHVLIVGAGDLGELVLRSLVRSRSSVYRAIGFLDPDPGKRNRSIHGARVLGTLADLERTVARVQVDILVMALPQPMREESARLRVQAEALGITVYEAGPFVEMHFAGEGAGETSGAVSRVEPGTSRTVVP